MPRHLRSRPSVVQSLYSDISGSGTPTMPYNNRPGTDRQWSNDLPGARNMNTSAMDSRTSIDVQGSQILVLSDSHPRHRGWNQFSDITASDFCTGLPGPDNSTMAAVIIEEIDNEWTQLLTKRYPSLDANFIQEHLKKERQDPEREARQSVTRDDVTGMALNRKTSGFHLDGIRTIQSLRCQDNRSVQPWSAAETGMVFFESATCKPRSALATHTHARYSNEALIHVDKEQRKVSTRISSCELHEGLHLFLVDRPLNMKSDSRRPSHDLNQRRGGDGLTLPMAQADWPDGKIFRPLSMFQDMFKLFTVEAVLESIETPTHPALASRRPDFVLHWLLVVTAWNSIVRSVEHDALYQQHHAATTVNVETFNSIGRFRRQLKDTLTGITDAKAAILLELEEDESQARLTNPTHQHSQTNTPQIPTPRTTRANSPSHITKSKFIPVASLPPFLSKLEDRLNNVSATLSEEIELLIGSVQVRDSEISKQQAERATILTLLVAIYLPLQIVTAIFGMNTAEINDGKPNWRACVVALAVASLLTLCVFVGVKWWRHKRSAMQWERDRRSKKEA